ncbi:MAG TPA: L-asparaginase II, partial [Gammaproteobacteria bacterium]|nr:L-asparaginase II [Gammaproteobacteria bacterium]
LTACLAHNDNTQNYRLYSHPAQRRWFDVVGEFTGLQSLQLPWGYDGCGIPTLAVPLQRLAWAYARFADPSVLSAERADQARFIRQAIAENPHMYGGTGELSTLLVDMLGERLIVKNGAQGVYSGVLPELGFGLALKVDSGDSDAAKVVLGALLEKIAVLSVEQLNVLGDHFRPDILNSRGEVVGRAEPSSAWDQGVLPL